MGSASSIIINNWNMGTTYTGSFTASWSKITAVKGTITKQMQTSTNGSSFTTHATNPVTAAMAYARTLISADANNGILLRSPPILSLNVNTMEESGIVTTLASGAKTVTLTRDYSSVTALIVSADSTSARTAVYDNIVLGNPTTFDVYLFTAAGAQVAGTISYRFQGV